MAEVAKKYNCPAQLYLSHSQDRLRNPLPYDGKIFWAKRAFGNLVDVVDSPARNIFEILPELCKEGYTDIIYVGGSDRIGGEEDITQNILNYNGRPNKKGEIPYEFDSIKFVNAGERDSTSKDIAEMASASAARAAVVNQDFDMFKKLVPYNEKDADNLFRDIYGIMVGDELPDDLYDLPIADDIIDESYFYGAENEFMAESDKYLYEDYLFEAFNNIKSILKNLFMETAKGLFPDIISMNTKHIDELVRVKLNTTETMSLAEKEEKLNTEVYSTLVSIDNSCKNGIILNKDLQLNGLVFDKVPQRYNGEANVSSTFKCFKVIFNLKDLTNNEDFDKTYYICINYGDRKDLIAEKTMANITDVPFTEVKDKVIEGSRYSSVLEQLLAEAADTSKVNFNGNLDDLLYSSGFKFSFTPSKDLLSKMASIQNRSFIIDFSEVFGSVALANVVSQLTGNISNVTIPNSSNNQLVDYYINYRNQDVVQRLNVSAKVDSGGKPSSKSMIDSIISYYSKPGNVVPKNLESSYEFAEWLYENVSRVGTHRGFVNLENLLIDLLLGKVKSSWAKELNVPLVNNKNKDFIFSLLNHNLSNREDIRDFYNECNHFMSAFTTSKKRFSPVSKIISDKAFNLDGASRDTYLSSVRTKYLSSIMIEYINESPLMSGLNELFRESFDLIQVHLSDSSLGRSRSFEFKTKNLATSNYHFINNTGISGENFLMTNQRVAMSLE